MDDSTQRSLFAAAASGVVFAWYAMPDVVRSRGVRTVLKTGLLGVTAVGAAKAPQIYKAAGEDAPEITDLLEGRDPGVLLAVGGAALVGGTVVTVASEKWIFGRGERLRADGRRWAHTPLALGLAALCGLAAYADAPA